MRRSEQGRWVPGRWVLEEVVLARRRGEDARQNSYPVFTRQNIANFLQGLFVLPLCALFGLMTALLFQSYYHRPWAPWAVALCAGLFALFPLAGALKTKQRSLSAGLVAGLLVTIAGYFALRPHA